MSTVVAPSLETLIQRRKPGHMLEAPFYTDPGIFETDSTRQLQRIGRERSPPSAASLSTSTKFAKAQSVKRCARMKPMRNRAVGSGEDTGGTTRH